MSRARAAAGRLPSADDTVLAEIVRRLVSTYQPEKIYLFGSVARGDAGPDSDFDILVVVPDAASPRLRDCDPAYQALRGLGVAKDVLVWTRSDFESRLALKASLPSTVVRDGRLLYAT